MSRFYFHQYDDVETRDSDGLDMSCVSAARLLAINELRRLYSLQRVNQAKMSDRFEIADADGRVLDTVYLADVV